MKSQENQAQIKILGTSPIKIKVKQTFTFHLKEVVGDSLPTALFEHGHMDIDVSVKIKSSVTLSEELSILFSF